VGGSRPIKAVLNRRADTVAGDLQMDWLLKVRAVVARSGEMDAGRWWNTEGQLGPYGAKALGRGLPRTHHFAQARSVFMVAGHRCEQVFNPMGCVSLWRLTDRVEDEFDRKWEAWLDSAREWAPFFEELAGIKKPKVVDALRHFDLVTEAEMAESATALTPSDDGRAVRATGTLSCGHRTVAMLALGFGRAEPGKLVVPYAKIAADAQRSTKGEIPPADAPSEGE
jgi:hypothetical protein